MAHSLHVFFTNITILLHNFLYILCLCPLHSQTVQYVIENRLYIKLCIIV